MGHPIYNKYLSQSFFYFTSILYLLYTNQVNTHSSIHTVKKYICLIMIFYKIYDISMKYKVILKDKLFYFYLLRNKIDIFMISFD